MLIYSLCAQAKNKQTKTVKILMKMPRLSKRVRQQPGKQTNKKTKNLKIKNLTFAFQGMDM